MKLSTSLVCYFSCSFGQTIQCNKNKDCLSDPKPRCRDGSCVCVANQCNEVWCNKDSHCAYQQTCEHHFCVDRECTHHNQCWNSSGRGRCIDNACQFGAFECWSKSDCDASLKEACDLATRTCVQKECRDDAHCGPDAKCNENFECEQVECSLNSQCNFNAQQLCVDYKCVEYECLSDINCGEKEECTKDGFCERVQCKMNNHCGLNEKCKKKHCVPTTCSTDAQCKQEPPLRAFACQNSVCERVECVENLNCGDRQVCMNNRCVEVWCTENDHCLTYVAYGELPAGDYFCGLDYECHLIQP